MRIRLKTFRSYGARDLNAACLLTTNISSLRDSLLASILGKENKKFQPCFTEDSPLLLQPRRATEVFSS